MRDKLFKGSLERIVPKEIDDSDHFNQETLKLHLDRYAFAQKFAPSGRVLDIACGVGYGSAFLAEKASNIEEIIGVDLDEEAINYARKMYANEKISFLCQDALNFHSDQLFDTIITLETIEHLPNPALFLSHIKSLLKPSGILIASVPITFSTDANPHHLHDFTKKSFTKLMLTTGFSMLDSLSQKQSFSPFKIIERKDNRLSNLRPNLLQYYLIHPKQTLKRIQTTMLYGFNNHYLTVAIRKDF